MMKELKEKVDAVQRDCERLHLKMVNLRALYLAAEAEWYSAAKKFRELDFELALIDGRLKKLPPATKGEKKVQKEPVLTLEQIQAIAAKLGVQISVEEPTEDDDGLS